MKHRWGRRWWIPVFTWPWSTSYQTCQRCGAGLKERHPVFRSRRRGGPKVERLYRASKSVPWYEIRLMPGCAGAREQP